MQNLLNRSIEKNKGDFVMTMFEELMIKNSHIPISDCYHLRGGFKGIYANGAILIDSHLSSYHKHEILAEELAHYDITYGNIVNQKNILNRKLELKARRQAYESVITLQGIIDAFEFGVQNLHEMAIFFEVSKSFVKESLNHYKMKYGLSTECRGYLIQFEPLIIYKDI